MDDQSVLMLSPNILTANYVYLTDEEHVLTVAQFVLTDDWSRLTVV